MVGMELTKATVAGTWIVGLVLALAGVVAAIVGGVLGAHFSTSENAGTMVTAWAGTTGGIVLIAGLIAAFVGGLIQFVAWIMGLVATGSIGRWGWFVVLLVLGLVGLGFFVMLAYVIWGPSERHHPQALTSPV